MTDTARFNANLEFHRLKAIIDKAWKADQLAKRREINKRRKAR